MRYRVNAPNRRVVTSFLRSSGKILLLHRSEAVGTHRGRWAGVSGYIEGGEEPHERALIEIAEETGLSPGEVKLVKAGEPLPINNSEGSWLVHPFLFDISDRHKIRLDWEHTEYRWVDPEEIVHHETVPGLSKALLSLID